MTYLTRFVYVNFQAEQVTRCEGWTRIFLSLFTCFNKFSHNISYSNGELYCQSSKMQLDLLNWARSALLLLFHAQDVRRKMVLRWTHIRIKCSKMAIERRKNHSRKNVNFYFVSGAPKFRNLFFCFWTFLGHFSKRI